MSNLMFVGGGRGVPCKYFSPGLFASPCLASRELTAFQEANVSENTVVTFNQKS